MFSKACEYAIRASLYISRKRGAGTKLGIKEIAKEIDSPLPFTAKILQTLTREGIVSSTKGPNGGFFLDPKAKPVPLYAIVKAFDGDDVLHGCSLGLKECSDRFPCPIHHDVKSYQTQLRKIMREKTLQKLSDDLSRGKTFLKARQIKSSR